MRHESLSYRMMIKNDLYGSSQRVGESPEHEGNGVWVAKHKVVDLGEDKGHVGSESLPITARFLCCANRGEREGGREGMMRREGEGGRKEGGRKGEREEGGREGGRAGGQEGRREEERGRKDGVMEGGRGIVL